MFNVPANLRKFHRQKRDKSCSKDPYLLCRKALRDGIELRQDLYLSMRKLSNLSPSGNLSQDVSFSVDLFFKGGRPMNITKAVSGNPRFHHIKTVLSWTVFNTPFQITIVRSYRAAIFVFHVDRHVDTFRARALFAPRSCTVQKFHGSSLNLRNARNMLDKFRNLEARVPKNMDSWLKDTYIICSYSRGYRIK